MLQELAKGVTQPFLHLEQVTEIQPHEIRTLKRAGNYLRELVLQEAVHGACVLVKVCAQLIQPLSGSAVCGLQGSDAEHVHVTALVVVDGPVHLPVHGSVGSIDVGYLDACNVERLGGRHACDGVQDHIFGQSCPGRVVMARICELAVDFIGNHKDIVPEADLTYTLQL